MAQDIFYNGRWYNRDGTPFSRRLNASLKGVGTNITALTDSVSGGTKSWATAMSAWGSFNAVQLLFANHQAATATVDNHIVGVLDAAWKNGVYNINVPTGSWSSPAGAVTIPAATGATQLDRNHNPGYALGPKISIKSVPRLPGELDGGFLPLLLTRVLTLTGNTTMPYASFPAGWAAKYDAVNEGFSILQSTPQFADYVTVNTASWNTSVRDTGVMGIPIAGAYFYYDEALTTIAAIGDSIMAGEGDGMSQRSPFAFRACARARKQLRKVAYANNGISGSGMDDIVARGKAYLTLMNPDVIILAPYTINSSVSTQSNWDTQWNQVMDLATTQMAAGKKVIMTTALPNNGFTTAQAAMRNTQSQRVRDSGLPYADFDVLGTSAGVFAQAGYTVDGTHLTESAHSLGGSILQPVLDLVL